MTEKDIKSEITTKLNQGISKSNLYNEFKGKLNDESLRKIIASRPSYEQKLKFKTSHLILSIIWGFFILLELIGIVDLIVSFDFKFFISLIISIYITINIWQFDGRFFLPGIIWFILTIFNSFGELYNINRYDPDYSIILILAFAYCLILAIGIYLMYTIKKNIFSYYNWLQPILNRDNEIQFE